MEIILSNLFQFMNHVENSYNARKTVFARCVVCITKYGDLFVSYCLHRGSFSIKTFHLVIVYQIFAFHYQWGSLTAQRMGGLECFPKLGNDKR